MGINIEDVYRGLILHSYCATISFPGFLTACFRTTLVLFGLLLDLFYLTIRNSTYTFLAPEMKLVMAVVNDVNSVTNAIDTSFSAVRNLLPVIIIFVDCYCYYL